MPDVVLLTAAGLHVPVIPSNDVAGKTGEVLPVQIEYWFISNDGVMFGFTVTVNVTGNAH